MKGSGSTHIDWEGFFDRAHRRVFARLALLSAIGAVGALLLLGGGFSARGDLRWRLGPVASTKASISKIGGLDLSPHVKAQLSPAPAPAPAPSPQPAHYSRQRYTPPPIVLPPPEPPCAASGSGGAQYSDCLPRPIDEPDEPLPTGNGGVEAPNETAETGEGSGESPPEGEAPPSEQGISPQAPAATS